MPIGTFQVISLVYALAAVVTLWRLAREWRPLLDAAWTPGDRQLAQMVGVLLLPPPLVWLHEWAHAATMQSFGAPDARIHYFLYWGFVTSRWPFTPLQEFLVALAGPAFTFAVGWAMLAGALLVPMRPALALILATGAVTQLALVLALYPAMSLLGGWGDFALLYFSGLVGPSLAVGVVHMGSLVGFLWLMKQIWMQGFLAYPLPRPWRLPWVLVAPPEQPPPAE
jgi:hypothetical protein